ncbi:Uncharacterised protein [Listeria innocua]|nr:Uncharacterised protein [Listeria innocua]
MTKNKISFYVVDASEDLTMNIKEASEKVVFLLIQFATMNALV